MQEWGTGHRCHDIIIDGVIRWKFYESVVSKQIVAPLKQRVSKEEHISAAVPGHTVC